MAASSRSGCTIDRDRTLVRCSRTDDPKVDHERNVVSRIDQIEELLAAPSQHDPDEDRPWVHKGMQLPAEDDCWRCGFRIDNDSDVGACSRCIDDLKHPGTHDPSFADDLRVVLFSATPSMRQYTEALFTLTRMVIDRIESLRIRRCVMQADDECSHVLPCAEWPTP